LHRSLSVQLGICSHKNNHMNTSKKGLSVFILSVFVVLGVSGSFLVPTHRAYACYCYPNLAVFPNGKDPSCINHVSNNPAYCGGTSSAVNVSVTGNSATNGFSGNSAAPSSLSCSPSSVKDFKSLIMNLVVGCFYYLTVRIIIGLALVFFLWGVFKFIRSDGGEDRESGKQFMLWGIVGLFVIFSVMGLVSVLRSTFTLNETAIVAPR